MKSEVKKSKYHREIKPGVWVDVYDVLDAFDPDNRNSADDHAIKKMLLPGKRGAKDGRRDRVEAIQSLERSLQKIDERMALNPDDYSVEMEVSDQIRAGEYFDGIRLRG